MADAKKSAFVCIDEPEFRKRIKKPSPAGYLFFGEEDYLKSASLKSARDAVCPDEGLAPFNDVKLEGLDVTPDALLSAMSTLPMMSDMKLIEVTGMDFSSLKSSEFDDYVSVFSQLSEYDYNILIVSVPSGNLDEGYLPKKPSAALKKLSEFLTPVRFAKSTPLMLSRWAGRHFIFNGVKADDAVCSDVVSYCGTDMLKLASEIDKISWYVLASGRDTVEPSDIKKVAIADTDYDAFAFTNALTDRNKARALSVLAEMKRRKTEPTVIMGEITRFACEMTSVKSLAEEGMPQSEIASRLKIHEFRVGIYLRQNVGKEQLSKLLSLCADADAAIKLSSGTYEPIERLICSY